MRKNLRLAGLIIAHPKAELLFVVNVKAKYGWNDESDRTLLVLADNTEQAQRHAAAHMLKTRGDTPRCRSMSCTTAPWLSVGLLRRKP